MTQAVQNLPASLHLLVTTSAICFRDISIVRVVSFVMRHLATIDRDFAIIVDWTVSVTHIFVESLGFLYSR
jgi:hypothetical protein